MKPTTGLPATVILQTLTYSAAGAPFLVGRSAACALATATIPAADPSSRLLMSVIFRPPVKINGSWLKPRTLSPRPDTRPMFQVSSAPLPVSRASASFEVPPEDWTPPSDSRPGNPPSHKPPYPTRSPHQFKNGKIWRSGAFPQRLLHKSHESASKAGPLGPRRRGRRPAALRPSRFR